MIRANRLGVKGISNMSKWWSKLIGPNPKVSTRLKASPKTCSQLSILSICSLNRGRKVGFLWPRTREAIYFKVFLGDYSLLYFSLPRHPSWFFFKHKMILSKTAKKSMDHLLDSDVPPQKLTKALKIDGFETEPLLVGGFLASFSRDDLGLVSGRESHGIFPTISPPCGRTFPWRQSSGQLGGKGWIEHPPPRVPVTFLRILLEEKCFMWFGGLSSKPAVFCDPNL